MYYFSREIYTTGLNLKCQEYIFLIYSVPNLMGNRNSCLSPGLSKYIQYFIILWLLSNNDCCWQFPGLLPTYSKSASFPLP